MIDKTLATRHRGRLRKGVLAAALGGTLIVSVAAGQQTAFGTVRPASTNAASLVGWYSDWGQSSLGDQSGGQGSWYPGAGGSGGSSGSDGSDGSGGSGGSGGSDGSGTPNGPTATTAQSTGVVLINTELPYEQAEAAGTGMVLTATGQVLTNYHVVEGAGTITVTLPSTGTVSSGAGASGKTYAATVIGHDQKDDVALLQLKNASGLSTVRIDDDRTAVGDAVTAVGNAGGTGTLTAAPGSITSLKASVTTAAEGSVAGETLRSMIETDADIVPGDSGGPLVDREGEVVGIDTAASSGGAVDGYAIPIAEALGIVQQIRSGDSGDGVRIGAAAFLGVEVTDSTSQDGSDDSGSGGTGYGDGGSSDGGYGNGGSGYGDGGDSFGSTGGDSTDPAAGAMVGDVVSGSAAAAAGIEPGDVITEVGSRTITAASDVSAALTSKRPGDRVRLSWLDSTGAAQSATVTLGSSPVA